MDGFDDLGREMEDLVSTQGGDCGEGKLWRRSWIIGVGVGGVGWRRRCGWFGNGWGVCGSGRWSWSETAGADRKEFATGRNEAVGHPEPELEGAVNGVEVGGKSAAVREVLDEWLELSELLGSGRGCFDFGCGSAQRAGKGAVLEPHGEGFAVDRAAGVRVGKAQFGWTGSSWKKERNLESSSGPMAARSLGLVNWKSVMGFSIYGACD